MSIGDHGLHGERKVGEISWVMARTDGTRPECVGNRWLQTYLRVTTGHGRGQMRRCRVGHAIAGRFGAYIIARVYSLVVNAYGPGDGQPVARLFVGVGVESDVRGSASASGNSDVHGITGSAAEPVVVVIVVVMVEGVESEVSLDELS